MSHEARVLPIASGSGSVTDAPNLPAGFSDTFTSRYIDTATVRLHAVIGGDGPPLLLVHGWPQTWYAWRMVMHALARDFEVIAVDQRGFGLSDKPPGGYDAVTLAADTVAVLDALGHERFAVYGTDTGLLIAYAVARDYPQRVSHLAVSEGPLLGIAPSPPLFLPPQQNERLWHLMFNQLPAENEQLVTGREALFFGAKFAGSAGSNKLPAHAVDYYVEALSDADSLRGSFGFYRAIPTTIAQNQERKDQRLTMPVLAMGGVESGGDSAGMSMKLVADDVQTVVVPDAGHWIAEQNPAAVVDAITAFLAPHRELVEVATAGSSTS